MPVSLPNSTMIGFLDFAKYLNQNTNDMIGVGIVLAVFIVIVISLRHDLLAGVASASFICMIASWGFYTVGLIAATLPIFTFMGIMAATTGLLWSRTRFE